MERLQISAKQWGPPAIRRAISDAKNALVGPAEYASLALDPLSRAAARVYELLDRTLRESNAADFDDLLVLPVRILQQNPERLAAYRAKFRYLLVDEYQDTNRAQYQLVKLLGGEHGNVQVVGDDDQSIYGWRGADVRNILDFEKDFPSARVVRLEENYRSTPEVLAVANAAIAREHRPPRQDAARDAARRRAGDGRRRARRARRSRVRRRARSRRAARATAGSICATSRCSIARTRRAARSRRRSAGTRSRTASWARCASSTGARSAISWRSSKLIANPADDEAFRRAAAVPQARARRHHARCARRRRARGGHLHARRGVARRSHGRAASRRAHGAQSSSPRSSRACAIWPRMRGWTRSCA